MKLNVLSLFAALAVGLLANVAEGQTVNRSRSVSKKVVTTGDCCGWNQFCCGGRCLRKSLQPLVRSGRCAGPSTCCGTPTPTPTPTPPADCCPTDTFCCGNTCQPVRLRPVILCATPTDCTEDCKTDPPAPPSDPCSEEPKVVGNCRGAFPRWSFIEKTGQCEKFSYGGCGGTGNNFESEAECKKTCNVEDPAPPPPEKDCCPKGEFCCDTACLPDGAQTFAPCGANKCTCDDPEPEPCICTKEYAPLCNPETGVTYGNRCEAVDCGGEDPEDLVEGTCEDQEDPEDPEEPPKDDCCAADEFCCGTGCLPLDQQPFTACLAVVDGCCSNDPGPIGPGCICPAVFAPVCSKSTGKTYGNQCEANCAKDKGPFTEGACGSKY